MKITHNKHPNFNRFEIIRYDDKQKKGRYNRKPGRANVVTYISTLRNNHIRPLKQVTL